MSGDKSSTEDMKRVAIQVISIAIPVTLGWLWYSLANGNCKRSHCLYAVIGIAIAYILQRFLIAGPDASLKDLLGGAKEFVEKMVKKVKTTLKLK